jgi:hypothetical protein
LAVPDWHAWASFLEAIREAEKALGCAPHDERFYRGHADDLWPLLPTLQRLYQPDEIHEVETSLFFEFQARARELHHLQLSDWDVLFFMRHHGVPTRLLDWTETLGIALYFALEAPPPPAEGGAAPPAPCIWVMNPYRLNGRGDGDEDLFAPRNLGWAKDEATYYDYGELLLENEPFEWEEPLAIYPQQKPARMGAQRGWFTIHGWDPRPLEDQCDYAVRKVPIAPDAVAAAREVLRIGGIDPYGIYADLDGLAATLVQKNAPRSPRSQQRKRSSP